MKFVGLVSGGKDSIFALMESIRHGHELLGCVHLGAPHCKQRGEEKHHQDQPESYMYQTAGSEVISTLVEECLGVPLICHRRVGTSVNTSLVYQPDSAAALPVAVTVAATIPGNGMNMSSERRKDEVEDLFEALHVAQQRFPDVEAVSSGAILSTYQRVRIENVCSRLGLTSLSFLWRRAPQDDILREMIHRFQIHAVLVKAACPPGLIPRKHLSKSIQELEQYFYELHDKYQFHVCGEGGEYETLVLDCPVYKKRLVLDEVEIIEGDDGVGVLAIHQCHSEAKDEATIKAHDSTAWLESPLPGQSDDTSHMSTPAAVVSKDIPASLPKIVSYLPHVQRLPGGLLHLSEIISPITALATNQSESDAAVQEALFSFQLLRKTLARHRVTPQDVILVHLYLSEISHFAVINGHYRDFFGTFLPPSRSCVALGKRVLPGGRRILLDCIVQCGSGEYLRSVLPSQTLPANQTVEEEKPMGYAMAAQINTTSKLREVLHVQSLSHWAPTCIGPYSQANTLRSGVIFLAGQVGFNPTTMKLRDTWPYQLTQCWTNVANVMDALHGGSLDHMLSCLIYIGTNVILKECDKGCVWTEVEALSYHQIATNAGITPGAIESTARIDASKKNLEGYEDEETMLEMKRNENMDDQKRRCPLLLVAVPELPAGAMTEVEVIAATQRAASHLPFTNFSTTIPKMEMSRVNSQWDLGFDFGDENWNDRNKDVDIKVVSRFLGDGCVASVIITANTSADTTFEDVSADPLLGDMTHALDKFFEEAGSGLTIGSACNIRLYYIGGTVTKEGDETVYCDDGNRLRSALASSIASRWPMCKPATTCVPVRAINLTSSMSTETGDIQFTFLAMHVILVDSVHLETEMWIRQQR